MTHFDTVGALGEWREQTGIRVVDPPIPLTAWNDWRANDVYSSQPAVRKVTGFIARQLASTNVHTFRRKGDTDRERVSGHPLAAFMRDPAKSPGVTPQKFWTDFLLDGLLYDRQCAIVHYDKDTALPDRLQRLPAERTRFERNDEGGVGLVHYTDQDGYTKTYDPLKLPMLVNAGYSGTGVNGVSPATTLSAILEETSEAVLYRRDLMRNRANLSGVLERETPWSSTDAYNRFRTSFAEFRKGGTQSGGVPILEDGMKWRDVQSFKPSEVLDIEARRLSEAEVATMYWIYPELLGIREGTHSNMRSFRAMLYSVCLGPYYSAWEQLLNLSLLPLFPGASLYLEANVESKLSGSFEEQADFTTKLTGAPIFTRNESRSKFNYPPVEGGDELITPLNVIAGGQSSPLDGE